MKMKRLRLENDLLLNLKFENKQRQVSVVDRRHDETRMNGVTGPVSFTLGGSEQLLSQFLGQLWRSFSSERNKYFFSFLHHVQRLAATLEALKYEEFVQLF